MDEITIYDIARKAGVSASTVSRVINNYPHVKKETREKVLSLLKENNFVPNVAAQSLVTQSTKIIGILISDMRTTHHTDSIYYIERELSKFGYSCLIYNTGVEPEGQKKIMQTLSKRNIDALILVGSVYQNKTVADAIERYIPTLPVVMFNGYIKADNVYGVISDEKKGVEECVKLLSQKGRKNIAFVLNNKTPSNNNKLKGFEIGFEHYISDGNSYVLTTGSANDAIINKLASFIDDNPEIDSIIFSEDYLAMIGIHVILQKGKRIPDDIAVIGINNSRFSEITNPTLTSLDTMLYDCCTQSVNNLIHAINGDRISHKIVIEPVLVERNST